MAISDMYCNVIRWKNCTLYLRAAVCDRFNMYLHVFWPVAPIGENDHGINTHNTTDKLDRCDFCLYTK